jgi:probable rRNA maturation factor
LAAVTIAPATADRSTSAVDTGRVLRDLDAAVRVLIASERSIERVHVALVDDDAMDRLHRRHSGVAGTTDVLTFPAGDDPHGPVDVDIVVCVDEARRRAAEFGHPVEREIVLYAVHGLLHCLGHDDHDEAAFERMHAEEDRILTAIGVGPVFRPDRGEAAR